MSKVKYHVNPETGKTGQCSATVKGCQFAKDGQVPEHYDNEDDARKAYEKQNEENTFGNTIKKETRSISHKINALDVTDASKNYNYEKLDLDYERELLNEKTVGGIVEKINKEHEELGNANGLHSSEVESMISADEAKNDGVMLIISKDRKGNYNYEDTITRTNPDFDSNIYNVAVDKGAGTVTFTSVNYDTKENGEKRFENSDGPLSPENNRRLIRKNHSAEEDYNSDDRTKKLNHNTYVYALKDAERESLYVVDKQKTIQKYKEIIDDPSKPNWMVLPEQKNKEQTVNRYPNEDWVDDYDENSSEISPSTKITDLIEQKNAEISKMAVIKDAKQQLPIVEKEAKDNTKKAMEIKKTYDAEIDKQKKLKLAEEVNNAQHEAINSFKQRDKLDKIVHNSQKSQNEINERIKNIDNKIEKFEKEDADNSRKEYEDNIAAHYPSTDPKERRKAAQQWMKENEDKLPNFIENNRKQRESYGYYK